MRYQILKNYGPGYHSRIQSAEGFLSVLFDHHLSVETAKAACRRHARRELVFTLQPAKGSWPEMMEGVMR